MFFVVGLNGNSAQNHYGFGCSVNKEKFGGKEMGLSQSLWTGLSSLKSHQSWTDVISNNLSHSNTDGFKYSDVSFSDMLYSNFQSGSNENGGRGSTNPASIGTGVSLNSITQNFIGGDMQQTTRTFDCAIDGNGFFIAGGLTSNASNYYTKNGRFYLGAPLSSTPGFQNLQTADGLIVQGYQAINGVLTETLTNISLPTLGSKIDGVPTTKFEFGGNLNSNVSVAEGNSIPTVADGSTTGGWLSNTGATINVGAVETSEPLLENGVAASGATDLTNLSFERGSSNVENLFSAIPSGFTADSRELTVSFKRGSHTYEETFVYGTDGTTLDDLTAWLTGGVGDAGTSTTQRLDGGALGTIRTREYTVAGDGYAAPAEQAGGYYGYDDDGNFSLSLASNLGKDNTISDIVISTETTVSNASTGETRNLQGFYGDLFDPNPKYEEDKNAGSSSALTDIYLPATEADAGTVKESERVSFTLVSRDSNGSTWRWYANSDYESVDEADLNKGSGIIRFGTNSQSGEPQVIDSTIDGGTNFTMDFSNMTQLATNNSAKITQDGIPDGELDSYLVDQFGVIDGVYTNGRHEQLARIGMAVIPNAQGMQQVGDTLWTTNKISGEAIYNTTINEEEFGVMRSKYIETSNVDAAKQMTQLLMSQRGYQLGSKIVTTADDLLKEAASMKR